MTPLRALIVDDEEPALDALRSLLDREADVTVVDECRNGADAVASVRRHAPDVIFLDIEMPGLNGFQVLEKLDPKHIPVVVFVTAYSEYAVDAFRVQALDYLLKPFDEQRLKETLSRVQERLTAGKPSPEEWLRTLGELGAQCRPVERLAVRDGDETVVVMAEQIRWIESEENYVRLHAGPRSYLARSTLRSLEERLDPNHFIRIHRTTIVNVDAVRKLRPLGHGDLLVILTDGTELTMSRRYRDNLERVLARLG